MPVFTYKAIDADASAASGTIIADTPRQARDALRDRGLTLQDLTPLQTIAGSRAGQLVRRWRAKQHAPKTLSIIREMATLLAVGVPLLDAIDTIIKQHHGYLRGVLMRLRDAIAAGSSLADAMRQQPDVFDDYCVSITEVGQNAGTLDVALKRLAMFKLRAAQFRGRIGTALLYPAIVLTMAIGVSIFLMTFVVPRLLTGLLEAGAPVPAVTRLVQSASNLLVHQWWVILGGVLVGAIVVSVVLRTSRGKRLWHGALLRIPLVGEIIRKQTMARVATIIAELMRSGIVFLQALEIARNTTRNVIFREALGRCQEAVAAGRDIAEALEDTHTFPPVVVQVFSVGQQSGRLEEMLDELAADYDQQVATATTRLTAALEPLLILVLVVVIGLIAFATVLPMLQAGRVL